MLATIVHRGLTVSLDHDAPSAVVEVHLLGRPCAAELWVIPDDSGWLVRGPDDGDCWFADYAEALGQAVLVAGDMFRGGLVRELARVG